MDRAVLAFPRSEAASGGFHDPGGQGREAQSRIGEARDAGDRQVGCSGKVKSTSYAARRVSTDAGLLWRGRETRVPVRPR
jgi:hypothetical protein